MKIELNIRKKIETPLLSRLRVVAEATYEGPTPSKDVIRQSLAAKLNKDQDLVNIRHIYTRFGRQYAKIIAHIYNTKKDMELYEIKTKKQKKAEAEAAKKAAEAAQKSEDPGAKNNQEQGADNGPASPEKPVESASEKPAVDASKENQDTKNSA